MAAGGKEGAPEKLHHLNGMWVAKEVAPLIMVKVAVVEDVDQSFSVVSVAGCCCFHGSTQGLGSGNCCGTCMKSR